MGPGHKRVKFYIGADNVTGKVALVDIVQEMNKHFEGYTIFETRGMWQGKGENSVVIEVITEDIQQVFAIRDILKERLEQQSILLTIDRIGQVSF